MADKKIDYPHSDPTLVEIINNPEHPARKRAQDLYYKMDAKGQKELDALRTEAAKRKARHVPAGAATFEGWEDAPHADRQKP